MGPKKTNVPITADEQRMREILPGVQWEEHHRSFRPSSVPRKTRDRGHVVRRHVVRTKPFKDEPPLHTNDGDATFGLENLKNLVKEGVVTSEQFEKVKGWCSAAHAGTVLVADPEAALKAPVVERVIDYARVKDAVDTAESPTGKDSDWEEVGKEEVGKEEMVEDDYVLLDGY